MPEIILSPGFTGASPGHWMHSLSDLNPTWVSQDNWNRMDRAKWIDNVYRSITSTKNDVILVGHSCGSVSIAQLVADVPQLAKTIRKLILVAPADVDDPTLKLNEVKKQAPLPNARLLVPSIVVCAKDDPFLSPKRAIKISSAWGSELIHLDAGGHLSTADGYGEWPLIRRIITRSLEC